MPRKKPPALKQTAREKAAGARQVERNLAARERRVRAREKELNALEIEYRKGKAFDEVAKASEALYVASQRPPLSSFIQFNEEPPNHKAEIAASLADRKTNPAYWQRRVIPPEPEPISPLPSTEPYQTDWIGGVFALATWAALVGMLIYYLW